MANPDKEAFFDDSDRQHLALTYDDVLIKPARSQVSPQEANLESRFSRNVELKIPMVSAAMDTVTESSMAIAVAKLGGIGVIHAGLSIEDQKREVRRVKLHLNGLIEKPISFEGDRSLEDILNECDERKLEFRTFPVIDDESRLIGLLTQGDIDFCDNPSTQISKIMTPMSEVTSAPSGTNVEQAYRLMMTNKKKILPLVTEDQTIDGLYVFSDVSRLERGDAAQYNVDNQGRLRVAAAVPTDEEAVDRVSEMAQYLDVAVIDTAQGDSKFAFKTLELLKQKFPDIDVVVGNISVAGSAKDLADAGADGIKVGQGPGAICTTRPETGMGRPQVTAVHDCVRAVENTDVPICADGGITKRGDVSIAIAAGAHSVMMGRMLSGTDEAPGDVIVKPDRSRVMVYRGMGSASAMRDSAAAKKRYGGDGGYEPLPEGVEAEVPYQGSVVEIIENLGKALRKSMSYVGSADIGSHRQDTNLTRVTNSGLRESHPHDVRPI